MATKDKDLLSVEAAANELGISSKTLRIWSDEGIIASQRTSGGHRRFFVSDVEDFKISMREGLDNRYEEYKSEMLDWIRGMKCEIDRFDDLVKNDEIQEYHNFFTSIDMSRLGTNLSNLISNRKSLNKWLKEVKDKT